MYTRHVYARTYASEVRDGNIMTDLTTRLPQSGLIRVRISNLVQKSGIGQTGLSN